MRIVLPLLFLVACAGQPSPNVVLIFVDDMGYADIGAFGEPGYETPHLDRLASEGARFTDFYVSQAVCSASRASLLTGMYANRIGILNDDDFAIEPDGKGGVRQKVLGNGKVDANTLYVVRLAAPLY